MRETCSKATNIIFHNATGHIGVAAYTSAKCSVDPGDLDADEENLFFLKIDVLNPDDICF